VCGGGGGGQLLVLYLNQPCCTCSSIKPSVHSDLWIAFNSAINDDDDDDDTQRELVNSSSSHTSLGRPRQCRESDRSTGLCTFRVGSTALYIKAVQLSNHVLLPPSSTASQRYNLRHRAHSLQLPEHSTQLSDSNFLTRMLYKNTGSVLWLIF